MRLLLSRSLLCERLSGRSSQSADLGIRAPPCRCQAPLVQFARLVALSRLPDGLQHVSQRSRTLVTIDEVVLPAPFPAQYKETCVLQRIAVAGGIGLGDSQHIHHLADAALALHQQVQHPYAGGVTQGLRRSYKLVHTSLTTTVSYIRKCAYVIDGESGCQTAFTGEASAGRTGGG